MRFRVKRRRVGNHIRFKVEEGFFRSEEIQICCSGENSYRLGRGPRDNQERRYKWRCRQDIKPSTKWCSRVPEIKMQRHGIISLTEKEGGCIHVYGIRAFTHARKHMHWLSQKNTEDHHLGYLQWNLSPVYIILCGYTSLQFRVISSLAQSLSSSNLPSVQLTSHLYVICLALGDLVGEICPHEEAGNEDKRGSYRGDLGYGFKGYNENLGYIG